MASLQEKLMLQRALASVEYRQCASEQERLHCLLYSFRIKPHVIIKELHYTRGKVYYFMKKEGLVRPTAGRPRVLEEKEEDEVKEEITRRADMMQPVTRRELLDIVRKLY